LSFIRILSLSKADHGVLLSYSRGFLDYSRESPITQEHSWSVITAFFEKEGLASQQISSFNYFIHNLKNIVSNAPPLEMTPNRQYHVTDLAQIVRRVFFSIFSAGSWKFCSPCVATSNELNNCVISVAENDES